MAKSKQSEETIIKLGEKLVKELRLESSNNTLGRWMSHYIAELIQKTKQSTKEKEKCILQKECCETILKLWSNRIHLPNSARPFNEIEPFLKIIDSLKKEEYSIPYFRYSNLSNEDTNWNKFISTVKKNSEDIFNLCMVASTPQEKINKEMKWVENHKDMLEDNESELIEHIAGLLLDHGNTVYKNKKGEDKQLSEFTSLERYSKVFENIELRLDKQKEELQKLKKQVLDSVKK